MNLNSVLNAEVGISVRREQDCKRKLAALRTLRSRASEALLQMCCDLQKNPGSLNPERISATVAEIKYLEGRTQQLERLLLIFGKPAAADDGDL